MNVAKHSACARKVWCICSKGRSASLSAASDEAVSQNAQQGGAEKESVQDSALQHLQRLHELSSEPVRA